MWKKYIEKKIAKKRKRKEKKGKEVVLGPNLSVYKRYCVYCIDSQAPNLLNTGNYFRNACVGDAILNPTNTFQHLAVTFHFVDETCNVLQR